MPQNTEMFINFLIRFWPAVLMVVRMLQCCVRRLSVVCLCLTLCIAVKRCVLEHKLLLTAYRKSYYEKLIGTKMNDLDLCLEVLLRSCQTFRHVHH